MECEWLWYGTYSTLLARSCFSVGSSIMSYKHPSPPQSAKRQLGQKLLALCSPHTNLYRPWMIASPVAHQPPSFKPRARQCRLGFHGKPRKWRRRLWYASQVFRLLACRSSSTLHADGGVLLVLALPGGSAHGSQYVGFSGSKYGLGGLQSYGSAGGSGWDRERSGYKHGAH